MEFASTEIDSSIIIFNLALVHHSNGRASMKTYSLCQIATALLSTLAIPSDSESLSLHVVVLNNFEVWCFDNHKYQSMIACFEEMKYIIVLLTDSHYH